MYENNSLNLFAIIELGEIINFKTLNGEIYAQCIISDNSIKLVKNDGTIWFHLIFDTNGFYTSKTNFEYTNQIFTGLLNKNEEGFSIIERKDANNYVINSLGDYGSRKMMVYANVKPKTMLQNAINFIIIFQDLTTEIFPFITGIY